jgi:hypothetical protein
MRAVSRRGPSRGTAGGGIPSSISDTPVCPGARVAPAPSRFGGDTVAADPGQRRSPASPSRTAAS